MNYLAHFHLAKNEAGSRVGNFLGDFVTGHPETLTDQFPSEVIDGIMMHRHVDRFTDDHQEFRKAKRLLPEPLRRYSGVAIDLFTDHFLVKHWADYSSTSLKEFCPIILKDFQQYEEVVPETPAYVAQRMLSENWFERYGTTDGILYVLQRITERRPKLKALPDTHQFFLKEYAQFEKHCLLLLKEAEIFAETY